MLVKVVAQRTELAGSVAAKVVSTVNLLRSEAWLDQGLVTRREGRVEWESWMEGVHWERSEEEEEEWQGLLQGEKVKAGWG